MSVHPWASSDPATSARLFEGGPGPQTTLANAAAWAVEAAIHDLAMGMSAVNIAGLVPNFMGVGGTAAAETGALLNALAGVMGGHCLKQQLIGLAAAELYAAARAGLIPSQIIDANRVECANDVAINPMVLGMLTGRIGELNAEYGVFWSQNAAVGTAYGSGLNALTTALLSTPPPAALGANPAGPAMMASSVVENTAAGAATTAARATSEYASTGMQGVSSAGGGMEQVMGGLTQALGSAVQPITGMFQTVPQMFQGLASVPQSLMGAFGGMFGGLGGQDAAMAARVPAEAVRALPGAAGGVGAVSGGGGGVGVGGGAPGLTQFTRPASSFEPAGGRATGLKPGLLNPAEVRAGPTASVAGPGMPVSPAGMLGRGQGMGGQNDKGNVQHARIVVGTVDREGR